MNIELKHLCGLSLACLLTASLPARADCRCDDGSVLSNNAAGCRDGSICHIIAEGITRFRTDDAASSGKNSTRANPAQRNQSARAKPAGICVQSPGISSDDFLYRCNDGSIRENNDCPDGNIGHLFKADSIACKQHDPNRPNRIALSEFIGKWNTWVPGAAYSVDDHVNNVRVNHTSLGSAAHLDLVISPNGTYVWKGIRGNWGTTNDDENPIVLYRAVDGHDWQVSILENWYGYLALSDATNSGIYYYGKR